MAISDTEKTDFLWKRVIFGVSKTASSADKFASNETIPSPLPVLPSAVWKDGDSIPVTAPASTSAIVQVYTGANRIRLTSDPTSPANVAWIAASSYGDTSTRLGNFIAPTFGSSYAVKVYIGDPDVGPAARIFPDTSNEEWVFDYAAGALVFTGNIPANKTATIGSGTVSVATSGVYAEVYQYVGAFGVGDTAATPALGDLTDVELSTGAQEGDVLTYKDGVWQTEALPAQVEIPFIPTTLGALGDVENGTGTPDEGAVLTWKDGVWQAEPLPDPVEIPFIPTTLGALGDVETGTGMPADGDVLTYKDGVWQAEAPAAPPPSGPTSLGELDDVEFGTPTPQNGFVLVYRDGVWQAEAAETAVGGLGTMSTQDADDVAITGGIISNVTLVNVTVDGGTF